MAKKPLPTPEQLRQLLRYEPDTGRFFWRRRDDTDPTQMRRIVRNWNARYADAETFTHISKRGYLSTTVLRIRHYAHRVAWAMHYGQWPDGQIDHIDGDRTNNRIANLRVAPQSANMKNTRLDHRNKTGTHGVWWDAGRQAYQVYITVDRRRINLGRFALLDDAVAARKAAELKYGFHPNHGVAPAQSGPAREAQSHPACGT